MGMKTIQPVPPGLIEQDGDRAMPPGGGLLIAILGSLIFWALLIWVVL